jgi:hypothetical protein
MVRLLLNSSLLDYDTIEKLNLQALKSPFEFDFDSAVTAHRPGQTGRRANRLPTSEL